MISNEALTIIFSIIGTIIILFLFTLGLLYKFDNKWNDKLEKLDNKWNDTRELFFKAELENNNKFNEYQQNQSKLIETINKNIKIIEKNNIDIKNIIINTNNLKDILIKSKPFDDKTKKDIEKTKFLIKL